MQKANQRNTIHKVNQIWTWGYDKDRYATCKESNCAKILQTFATRTHKHIKYRQSNEQALYKM